jgi:hypothetical protein
MAKRTSINARSKRVENLVQKKLWPGTYRLWKEREDVGGPDFLGRELRGEVKNDCQKTIASKSGAYMALYKAYNQCVEAINSKPDQLPHPTPFSALWPVGSRKEEQRLVMYRIKGELRIMTLEQFQRTVVDNYTWDD